MADDASRKPPLFLTHHYVLRLPVSVPGDDVQHELAKQEGEGGAALANAFEGLARLHDLAAARCRRIVGLAREIPDLKVDAYGPYVRIEGPPDRFESLVADGVLEQDASHDGDRGAFEIEMDAALREIVDTRGDPRCSAGAADLIPGALDIIIGDLTSRNSHWRGVNPDFVLERLAAVLGR